jgi:hypothetical protein
MRRHIVKVGDRVRKIHVFDGGPKAGTPVGPVLIVEEIIDHTPVDGPGEKGAIAVLSDGSWAHIWNLVPQEKGETDEGKRDRNSEDY